MLNTQKFFFWTFFFRHLTFGDKSMIEIFFRLHGKKSFDIHELTLIAKGKLNSTRDETNYLEKKEIITYCQVRLLLIPSLNRSRKERWRLGPEPEM
jgi:hypothetical protein